MLDRPSSTGEKMSRAEHRVRTPPAINARRVEPVFLSSFILAPSSLPSHPQYHGQPQHFGDAPRLRRASDGPVREVGLEDFADLADAGVALHVLDQRPQPGAGLLHRLGGAVVDLEVSVEEAADEPGPDGAVVVGRVAVRL